MSFTVRDAEDIVGSEIKKASFEGLAPTRLF